MAMRILAAVSLLAVVGAMELTPDNWDAETAGKSVFVKFFAPWCGHCKSIKPAWDKLMDEFKGSPTSLVADVDCIDSGKALCETHGVSGFPTIKYGDPSDLKDYSGGRDFDSLQKFASESLGPQCGPGENIELCSPEMKAQIEGYMKMSADRMEGKIRNAKKLLEEEAPVMKKVIAYLKKAKAEL